MHKYGKKPDPLREKTLNLAVRIVNLSKYLMQEKNEYTISKQVLRSGTNPGAMVREAANAESGLDFIHKLSVAQKEAGETLYWLELLFRTNYLAANEYESIYADTEEILRLIKSSIVTRKKTLATKTASALTFLTYYLF
ncbi:four helix bundle protein [Rudanella lutea]|uniref:four helix bundle protein n=1 Tax=Rudanella lutea TaxID=451374 RepID=UPI00037316DE|nr:four helix bundle protein [Rudanella lutea]